MSDLKSSTAPEKAPTKTCKKDPLFNKSSEIWEEDDEEDDDREIGVDSHKVETKVAPTKRSQPSHVAHGAHTREGEEYGHDEPSPATYEDSKHFDDREEDH